MAWRRVIVVSALTLALQTGCDDGPLPTAPEPVQTPDSCLARAVFAEAPHSNYRLPFPVGTATTVLQAYCSPVPPTIGIMVFPSTSETGEGTRDARGGSEV
jgi:hypothetical protein